MTEPHKSPEERMADALEEIRDCLQLMAKRFWGWQGDQADIAKAVIRPDDAGESTLRVKIEG